MLVVRSTNLVGDFAIISTVSEKVNVSGSTYGNSVNNMTKYFRVPHRDIAHISTGWNIIFQKIIILIHRISTFLQ
jgi:hypothetical protein